MVGPEMGHIDVRWDVGKGACLHSLCRDPLLAPFVRFAFPAGRNRARVALSLPSTQVDWKTVARKHGCSLSPSPSLLPKKGNTTALLLSSTTPRVTLIGVPLYVSTVEILRLLPCFSPPNTPAPVCAYDHSLPSPPLTRALHIFSPFRGEIDLTAIRAALGSSIALLAAVPPAQEAHLLEEEWSKWEAAAPPQVTGVDNHDDDVI